MIYVVNYASKIVNWYMRQKQISNTLETIIDRTVSTLTRNGVSNSYSDRLMLEFLADESSCASRIIHTLAGGHGATVIMRKIVQGLSEARGKECESVSRHYDDMCSTLIGMLNPQVLTSAHLLYGAAFDSTTVIHGALHGYGIAAEDILREIEKLECGDDVRWVS